MNEKKMQIYLYLLSCVDLTSQGCVNQSIHQCCLTVDTNKALYRFELNGGTEYKKDRFRILSLSGDCESNSMRFFLVLSFLNTFEAGCQTSHVVLVRHLPLLGKRMI